MPLLIRWTRLNLNVLSACKIMKFNYQARTKTGEIRSGVIEASSKEAAAAVLQRYGLYVTFLEETSVQPFWLKKIKLFDRVPKKELVMFSRQFSIMFKSRVSLMESLNVLAGQIRSPLFKEYIEKISEDVRGGVALSQALSYYPKVFSPFYVSMVKAGEASGTLSSSLEYLADHLEREYNLSGKIKGAMVYPCFILIVMFAVLVVMLWFVVPQMTELLKETGQELPFLTRFVLGVSDFLRRWGWLIAVSLAVLLVGVFQFSKSKSGKSFFDEKLLRLPFLGSSLKMICLSRFAENLSVLISGGLSIVQALEITGFIVDNTVYQKIIFAVRDEVRKGGMINTVLVKRPDFFPPVFTQMVLVGERTGTLDSTLMNLVDFYEKEVDRSITVLLSLLEPIMLLFLGLVVGGLVASILMPLYQITAL